MWILNSKYNAVKNADQQATRRMRQADQKAREAKEVQRRAEWERRKREAENNAQTQQILAQVRNEANRLMQDGERVHEEMERELTNHIQRTQQEMESLREDVAYTQLRADEIDQRIATLSNQISRRFQELADAAAREKERAGLYTSQYTEFLRQIYALHPEKLTPGVVEQDFEPVTGFLEMDMANGDYQAAIGVAQTKIPELLSLRLRLEVLNAEFEEMRAQAQNAIARVEQYIQRLSDPRQNVRNVLIDGSGFSYNGDLMYWTNGLFQGALDNFDDTSRRYARAEEMMDLEGMRLCLEHIRQVELQLLECEDLANEQFWLHGMIINLASRICASLDKDEAWTLTEEDFADGDLRRSFRMAYMDGDGNTASFVVVPNREISPSGRPGEIQFLVDVTGSGAAQDDRRCYYIRNGVLSRLAHDRIEIGEHNRSETHNVSPDKQTFYLQATAQGDKIKEERLAAVREQLRLTAQIQE